MNVRNFLYMKLTGKVLPFANIEDILLAQKLGEAIKTITGNPLNFFTKKAQKAIATKLTMSPIQDLNGYENPWPAGGGKNQFNIDALNISPITVTNGVATGTASNFNATFGMDANPIYENTKDSVVSISLEIKTDGNQSTSGNGIIIRFKYTDDTDRTIITVPNSTVNFTRFTGSSDPQKTLKEIHITYSASGQNVWYIQKVQVEYSSSASSYAPYSNICPISGRTSVSLYGCKKNQIEQSDLKQGYFFQDGSISSIQTLKVEFYCEKYIPVVDLKFTVGYGDYREGEDRYLSVAWYDANKNFLSLSTNYRDDVHAFDAPNNAAFARPAMGTNFHGKQYCYGGNGTFSGYEAYTETNEITITFPALGKNIIPYPYYTADGTYSGVPFSTAPDGKITASGTTSGVIAGWNLVAGYYLASGTYTLSVTGKHSGAILVARDREKGVNLGVIYYGSTNASVTFTLSEDCSNFAVYFNVGTVGVSIDIDAYVQLESGSTATNYEPYTKTCYSGTLDVETGVLTVDKVVATFVGDNTVTWLYSESGAKRRVYTSYLREIEKKTKSSSDMLANYLKYDASGNYPNAWSAFISNVYVLIIGVDKSISSVNDWKDYLSANNLQVCYEIETPITIHLTPNEVKLIKGVNNIWTDGDEITLTYKG